MLFSAPRWRVSCRISRLRSLLGIIDYGLLSGTESGGGAATTRHTHLYSEPFRYAQSWPGELRAAGNAARRVETGLVAANLPPLMLGIRPPWIMTSLDFWWSSAREPAGNCRLRGLTVSRAE